MTRKQYVRLIRGFLTGALLLAAPLLTVAFGAVPARDSSRVAVLYSPRTSYRTPAAAIESALKGKGWDCLLLELPSAKDKDERDAVLKRLAEFQPTVIAAAGPTATTAALETVPDVPVIFFMVPNARDAPFVGPASPLRDRVAGVTSDISPETQIDRMLAVKPRPRKVAVLHSKRSARTTAAIVAAGRKRGLEVQGIETRRDEFPKAIETLNRSSCDAVLMVPDAAVYNSPTVQRLLLWGVRQETPVWAFSRNVVKAGAFAGLYCEPADVGRQTATLIQQVAEGTDVSTLGIRHPRAVGVAVNEHTAEQIGVSSDSALGPDVVRFGGRQ